MKRLNITFCGIPFINPFTVAASPSSDSRDKVKRAFDAGWGGAVLKTTALPAHAPRLAEPNMAGISYAGQPQAAFYNIDLISERAIEEIQEDIAYFKSHYPQQRVIGSIMASGEHDWRILVNRLEEAGADLIECSMSCPQGEHSIAGEGHMASSAIPAADPKLMQQTTGWIKQATNRGTPIIVKLTPNVTDIVEIAAGAMAGGADAVCAIDTVRGFIGIDIQTKRPKLQVAGLSTWGGLSGPGVKPIALGCVSKLAKSLPIHIAGVGGVSCWQDAVEFILLGARNIQVCTAISKYSFGMVKELCSGLQGYLDAQGYGNVTQLVGQSLPYLVEHSRLSRENKVSCHIEAHTCIKCGRCATACRDAGFGALTYTRGQIPALNRPVCRGCGVCSSVCPRSAITLR